MGVDIQAVFILASVGITLWLMLNFALLYQLGIYNKDALSELSLPEAVVIAGLSYISAYIIAQLFSRFA